ncbi:MAG TPA: hypothetical protein VFU07_04645 [Candidatus Lumbricidophila sp.]|nr:hypothetical protein [Candidatus Lumbricidophila sp.]
MTALPAIAALPIPAEAPKRRLSLAPATRRAPRVSFAIIAVAGIGLIVAAKLILSIALTEGAYAMNAAQTQQVQVQRELQSLGEQLQQAESPQFLARAAEQLGMVPNTSAVYLRLSDGAVLGQQAPSKALTSARPQVANALIDGAPSASAAVAGQTHQAAAAAAAVTPVIPDSLPTPKTH